MVLLMSLFYFKGNENASIWKVLQALSFSLTKFIALFIIPNFSCLVLHLLGLVPVVDPLISLLFILSRGGTFGSMLIAC